MMSSRAASTGVTLAEAIELLATPEDRAEADQAYNEMILREQLHRGHEASAGFVIFSPTGPSEIAHQAKAARLAESVRSKLRAGALVANANIDGASEKKDIPADEWQDDWDLWFADENIAQRFSSPKTKYENIRVHLPAAAGDMAQSRKSPGSPGHAYWPELFAEFLKAVAKNGLPPSHAETVRWFGDAADKIRVARPKEETVARRMVEIFGATFWDSLRANNPQPTD
jgi:hypothetical protein